MLGGAAGVTSALIILEIMGSSTVLSAATSRVGEEEFAGLVDLHFFHFSFNILSFFHYTFIQFLHLSVLLLSSTCSCTSLFGEGELVNLSDEMGGELGDRDRCWIGVNL